MPTQRLDLVPLSQLKGVGSALSARLAKLGLNSVQDLLLHLPLRYEDRTRLYPIAHLLTGTSVTVSGVIVHTDIQFNRRRMLVCQINDGTAVLTLRFFHFTLAMKNHLSPNTTLVVYGEVKRGIRGAEMIHPEYRLQNEKQSIQLENTLTPIYPTTEGLRQTTLRRLMTQALEWLKNNPQDELLPPEMSQTLPSFATAITTLHHPLPDTPLSLLENRSEPAQRRLILEELLAYNLSRLAARAIAQHYKAPAFKLAPHLKDTFLTSLPFSPTTAQLRVASEIEQDLQKNIPMMRLVQGDVGSGKTLVAAIAALNTIAQGFQVALMAPTELLAEQHLVNFRLWFTPLGITVERLVGKLTGKTRQTLLKELSNGEINLVIGTHALFQEQVQFQHLGLVIIDEQHRFGVHQRLTLWEKGHIDGEYPHQLIMTATPIPRTLAMAAYADLDISIIDELPPGRTPVTTVVIPNSRRSEVIQRVKHACLQEQRQVYWVCTLIDESEVLEAQAAEVTAAELSACLPELTICLVHGRMKPADKQTIMQAFKQKECHLLVATTVIEVGVDVPNASLMVIDNPERLGLAQLHQLRGRVGRGSITSHCVLLYQSPLSKAAAKRLHVLRNSNDGFAIAEQDLHIRGPGEVLGTRQAGIATFKVADLLHDQALIPEVHRWAKHIHQHHPQQAQALITRWLADNWRYSQA